MTDPMHPRDGVDPGRLIAAHHSARAFYRRQLLTADGPRRYLAGRGLDPFTREPGRAGGIDGPWHLGYAPPGWTALVEHLTAAGYSPAELIAAGLAHPSRRGGLVDVFRDRIMFPIHNHDGEPVAFLGRAAPAAAGSKVAKYLNSADTAIYHKRVLLYGLGEQPDRIHAHAAPVIVEGPTDVLAVWLTHPDPSQYLPVAACGTNLTDHHAATLASLPGARDCGITTAFDSDTAGRHATLRSWWHLSIHKGINLGAAVLPAGTDPADLALADPPALTTALASARPLAQTVVDITLDQLLARHPDALTTIEGRVQAVHALAAMLVDLPAQQIAHLAHHIADRTRSRIELVADIIIDHVEHDPSPRSSENHCGVQRSSPAYDGPSQDGQSGARRVARTDRVGWPIPPPPTPPTPIDPATLSRAPAPARPRRGR